MKGLQSRLARSVRVRAVGFSKSRHAVLWLLLAYFIINEEWWCTFGLQERLREDCFIPRSGRPCGWER